MGGIAMKYFSGICSKKQWSFRSLHAHGFWSNGEGKDKANFSCWA